MPSHGSVAKATRLSKEKYPEHYCPDPRCLWRTFDARTGTYKGCPKGIGHGLHPNVRDKIDNLARSMQEGIDALHASCGVVKSVEITETPQTIEISYKF